MADRWAMIDQHILHHQILRGLIALREEFGYSLRDAIDVFNERCDVLWQERPNEFTVSREDYGKGVYT